MLNMYCRFAPTERSCLRGPNTIAPSPLFLGWGTDSVPARVGPSGCSSLIKDESGSWSSDIRVRLNCRITELRQPIFWGNEILLSL